MLLFSILSLPPLSSCSFSPPFLLFTILPMLLLSSSLTSPSYVFFFNNPLFSSSLLFFLLFLHFRCTPFLASSTPHFILASPLPAFPNLRQIPVTCRLVLCLLRFRSHHPSTPFYLCAFPFFFGPHLPGLHDVEREEGEGQQTKGIKTRAIWRGKRKKREKFASGAAVQLDRRNKACLGLNAQRGRSKHSW